MSSLLTPRQRATASPQPRATLLADLLESVGLAVFESSDSEGETLTFVSEGLAELTGYPVESLLAGESKAAVVSLRGLIDAEDAALVSTAVYDSAESGAPYECEYRLLRADGVARRVRERGAVRDGRLSAVLTDVTDSVVARSWMVGIDAWYRAMVESASEAFLVMEERVLIDCNPAAERLFGVSKPELLHRTLLEVSPPTQPSGMPSAELFRQQFDELARGPGKPFEWRFLRPEGATVDAEVTLSSLPTNGGVPWTIAVVRDVTDRLRAEAERREKEALFHVTFERSPISVSITDERGRYRHVNQTFLDEAQLTRDQVIGRTMRELGFFTSEDQARIGRDLTTHGSLRNVELAMTVRGGDKVTALFSVTPFTLGGEVLFLVSSIDVTPQKQAERGLKEANEQLEQRVLARTAELTRANSELARAMSQLVQAEKLAGLGSVVAGVAHELNTPLGNVRTVGTTLAQVVEEFAQSVQSGLRKSTLERFLAQCRDATVLLERNAQRAHDLIHNFKQVAVDQTSMRRRQYKLVETIEEVLSTLHHMVRKGGHQVKVDVPAELELDSYPGALQQLITNWVSNSVIHGFEGQQGKTISLKAHEQGAEVWLEYRDDGKGMSEEHVNRAFEPFFTTRMGRGGSGLGLYIAYNLVTGPLGGRIALESEPNKGVRFEVVLPKRAPLQRSHSGVHRAVLR